MPDDDTLLAEQFALARLQQQSVMEWLRQMEDGRMPDTLPARDALTRIQREIRQLIKLRAELNAEREQDESKLDDILQRFDRLRDRHTE